MMTLVNIKETNDRIHSYIHRTPILTNETINRLIGANICFKCENFQKTGSFKARGGLNAVLQIAEIVKPSSFTTHSSGNHAQVLAYAAKKFGIPAYIVMPRTAPQVKKDAVRSYGAEVIECEPSLKAREESVENIIDSMGSFLIHPFNNDMVISGQATVAKELIEDSGQHLDCIVAPIGGGGLLSGISLATHYLSPLTIVYGAEPEGAAEAIQSFESGIVQKVAFPETIADGLLASLSECTLGHIRTYVKNIFLVNDEEIKYAMKLVWERMKIIIEPSSAVPLAVVIKRKEFFAGQKIGIVISGGNVDFSELPFTTL